MEEPHSVKEAQIQQKMEETNKDAENRIPLESDKIEEVTVKKINEFENKIIPVIKSNLTLSLDSGK